MWTLRALASEIGVWSGKIWRLVESQSHVATLKLVDTLDEQAILEAEIDGSKPVLPSDCAGLDYLLATPFRYAPYPVGSRFRRAGQLEGCFYGSERVETAVAEEAFHRLLFFLDSPATKRPENPQERTAFRVAARAEHAVDLSTASFDRDRALWRHPTDYRYCQAFADAAREAGIEVIRYVSVRDPDGGANVALLTPRAFRVTRPEIRETWHVFIRDASVQAVREMPRATIEISFAAWKHDPRVPDRLSS